MMRTRTQGPTDAIDEEDGKGVREPVALPVYDAAVSRVVAIGIRVIRRWVLVECGLLTEEICRRQMFHTRC